MIGKDPDVSNVLTWKGCAVLQIVLVGLSRIQSGYRWICEMGAASSRRCISGNSSALFSDLLILSYLTVSIAFDIGNGFGMVGICLFSEASPKPPRLVMS